MYDLRNRSLIQFGVRRAGSTDTGIVHIAAYRHIDRARARIHAIIVIGHVQYQVVLHSYPITRPADHNDVNYTVTAVNIVAVMLGRIVRVSSSSR